MFGIDLLMAFFAGLIWWQIIALIVLIISCGFALYDENALSMILTLIVGIVIFWSMIVSSLTVLSFSSILGFVVVYFGFGVVWSFLKFRIEVSKIIEYIKNDPYMLKNYTLKEATKIRIKDNIKNNRIAFWIMFWPFSVTGYFLDDFIYNLFENIEKIVIKFVKRIKSVYDRIADSMISKYE